MNRKKVQNKKTNLTGKFYTAGGYAYIRANAHYCRDLGLKAFQKSFLDLLSFRHWHPLEAGGGPGGL